MAKRPLKRLSRKQRESCEHRSDVRTAEFVVRRLRDTQEDLADLLPDFRTFGHFSEMEDIGWVLRRLNEIRLRYEKFLERGVWDERSY